jgi:hypothetical protein
MRSLALLLVVVGACGGGSGGTVDAARADAHPPDAPAADAMPTTVRITGHIIDVVSMGAVAQATVSILDHPEVTPVMSDMTGAYELDGVPANAKVTLHFDKMNYMPQVTRPIQLGDVDYLMYDGRGFDAMVTRAAVNYMSTVIGTPHDPARGAVAIRLEDSTTLMGLDGATATLLPVTGAANPVYFDMNGVPDPSLTATSTSGLMVFHNPMPGDAMLDFMHATRPHCIAQGKDAPPTPLAITVYADTITWIPFDCGP